MAAKPKRPLAREESWYPSICDLAKTYGWRVQHQRPARRQSGKISTAIMGHAGWPDFVFAHRGEGITIVAEVKVDGRHPTDEQRLWLEALAASGVRTEVWRLPSDWEKVVHTLTFGRGTVQIPML